MFGIADLVTVFVIKDGLEFLSKNPDHIYYIFAGFDHAPINTMVSPDHIKSVVEYISKNAINVGTHYDLDIQKLPSVAVVSSGVEEMQFIGDYGQTDTCRPIVAQPTVFASFDIKSASEDSIFVSYYENLDKKLWIGLVVTDGRDFFRIKSIIPGHPSGDDPKDTEIVLDKKIPDGYSLKGWKAQSLPKQTGYEVNASVDKVTVQINLSSSGAASVHRLLSILIRYCLKRGRRYFEHYGLQVPTFSYTPLMLTSPEELIYESTFTIETKVTDTWIAREFELNDNTKNVILGATAVPTDEDDDEVNLE